jgi:hypothetical protein
LRIDRDSPSPVTKQNAFKAKQAVLAAIKMVMIAGVKLLFLESEQLRRSGQEQSTLI